MQQVSYGKHNRTRGGYRDAPQSKKQAPDETMGQRLQHGPLRHPVNQGYLYRGVRVDPITGTEEDVYGRRNLAFENSFRPGAWKPGVVGALSKFDDARARAIWRSQPRNHADAQYSFLDTSRPPTVPYHPTEVLPNHLRTHKVDAEGGRHAATTRPNATQFLPDCHTEFRPYAVDPAPDYVYDENAPLTARADPGAVNARKPRRPFLGQYYGTDAQRAHAKDVMAEESRRGYYNDPYGGNAIGPGRWTALPPARQGMADSQRAQDTSVANDRIPLRVSSKFLNEQKRSRLRQAQSDAASGSGSGLGGGASRVDACRRTDTEHHDAVAAGDSIIQPPPSPLSTTQRRMPRPARHHDSEHTKLREFTRSGTNVPKAPESWKNALQHPRSSPYARKVLKSHQRGALGVDHTAIPATANANPVENPWFAADANHAAHYSASEAKAPQQTHPPPPVNSQRLHQYNLAQFNDRRRLEKERAYRSHSTKPPNLPQTKHPLYNNAWNLHPTSGREIYTMEDVRADPEEHHHSMPRDFESRFHRDYNGWFRQQRDLAYHQEEHAKTRFRDPQTWNRTLADDTQPPEFQHLQRTNRYIGQAETDPVLPERISTYDDTPTYMNENVLPDHIIDSVARYGPMQQADPNSRPRYPHALFKDDEWNNHDPLRTDADFWARPNLGADTRHQHTANEMQAAYARIQDVVRYRSEVAALLASGARDRHGAAHLQKLIEDTPAEQLARSQIWGKLVQVVETGRHSALDDTMRASLAQALTRELTHLKGPDIVDEGTAYEQFRSRARHAHHADGGLAQNAADVTPSNDDHKDKVHLRSGHTSQQSAVEAMSRLMRQYLQTYGQRGDPQPPRRPNDGKLAATYADDVTGHHTAADVAQRLAQGQHHVPQAAGEHAANNTDPHRHKVHTGQTDHVWQHDVDMHTRPQFAQHPGAGGENSFAAGVAADQHGPHVTPQTWIEEENHLQHQYQQSADRLRAQTTSVPADVLPPNTHGPLGRELLYTYWSYHPALQATYRTPDLYANALATTPQMQHLVAGEGSASAAVSPTSLYNAFGRTMAQYMSLLPHQQALTSSSRAVHALLDFLGPHTSAGMFEPNKHAPTKDFKVRMDSMQSILETPRLLQILGDQFQSQQHAAHTSPFSLEGIRSPESRGPSTFLDTHNPQADGMAGSRDRFLALPQQHQHQHQHHAAFADTASPHNTGPDVTLDKGATEHQSAQAHLVSLGRQFVLERGAQLANETLQQMAENARDPDAFKLSLQDPTSPQAQQAWTDVLRPFLMHYLPPTSDMAHAVGGQAPTTALDDNKVTGMEDAATQQTRTLQAVAPATTTPHAKYANVGGLPQLHTQQQQELYRVLQQTPLLQQSLQHFADHARRTKLSSLDGVSSEQLMAAAGVTPNVEAQNNMRADLNDNADNLWTREERVFQERVPQGARADYLAHSGLSKSLSAREIEYLYGYNPSRPPRRAPSDASRQDPQSQSSLMLPHRFGASPAAGARATSNLFPYTRAVSASASTTNRNKK